MGLTATGFEPKTEEEIRTEIEDAWRTAYGANVDLAPDSPDGQIIAIMVEREALLWEALEAIHSGFDPDENEGESQDSVAAITGTIRQGALASTVTLTLTGTASTVVSAGSTVSVDDTGERFTTDAAGTLIAVSAWAITTAYTVGQRVTNGGNVYECTVAGTSAGSGGPSGTGSAIVDSTVTWRYVGVGVAAVDVESSSETLGAVAALTGTITTIESPVSGWSSVQNLEDASPGREVESDEDLRIRRELELAGSGSPNVIGIQQALAALTGVTLAKVFENTGTVTDADGVPPQHIEAVVEGGTDQTIADELFENKAAGIGTYGGETESVTDSAGGTHTIYFSRPTDIDVWVEVDLDKNTDTYPADGDDQVEAAILAVDYSLGEDVYADKIRAAIMAITGVLTVGEVFIGTSSGPTTETPISVASRERGVLDSARIIIVSNNGTF